MKIVVLQDQLRSGGTERQSVLLANAFAAAGHETTLLTFRPGGALDPTVAPNVRRRVLQPLDLRLDWFAPNLRRRIAALAPNVVLCMGRMANCYAGSIQVASAHTAVISTMRTGKPLPRLFRRSLGIVRHVVANSHEARDTLVADYHAPADKISVIHNGLVFPAESSLVRNETLRAQHHATADTHVLLNVAMFRPEKNQRELIEIVAGLPAALNWQLWLAGDGPARPACEKLAAEKNLLSRIKFLGFQNDPSPLYNAADIAVHASWSESLSNFLIESQAHGLPAVAYTAQGIAESFIPGRTGWLVPRDERDMFRATLVHLFVDDAETRHARSADARAYARTTFDPGRQVAAYLDLFARLKLAPASSRLS